MKDSAQIRQFIFPDDYPAVLRLWEGSGPGIQLSPSDSRRGISQKLERDPELFLVAEAGGQMCGTVLGGFDGRRGMVYHLAVAEGFRRRGIGRMLMDELERRLRQKGCYKAYLLITKDNDAGFGFYEEMGWERMPLRIMGKEL